MKSHARTRTTLSPANFAALCGVAIAAFALSPAFAQNPTRQKTTGSHIARTAETADDTRLEPVEVMIGNVRDARDMAREARPDSAGAANLPLLGHDAFLDGDTSATDAPR